MSGDDFYMSNTEAPLILQDISVDNQYAKNSLYAEQITLIVTRAVFKNIQFSG